ncbi:hypothetical protein [Hyphomicrobium sp. NDB2Meth4]|uniref:hypothetical protein n=1 Tax=Hyphomicrobium sp. NDB2Meth4 TaxID=1892846 RepID=UPI000A8A9A40|nr:hypothetical protein [Hyphomicrobium sp. NDB2Meth4]
MTKRLLSLLVFLFLAVPAYAALQGTDSKPGDACSAGEAGHTRRNASSTQDPKEITLICNGSQWVSANGGGAMKGTNVTGACTPALDGTVKYNASASPPWQYCDGGTTSWLPFRLPQCADDDTGECTLAALRSSSDPNLVASSIRCGQNILGVTGTYDCTADPAAFSVNDLTGQATASLISSNTLTPTGYTDPRPVSVTGQGSPQVSVNGGAWVTSGWILPGYTVQARLTSASAYDTPYAATISIGGVSDTWNVRTKVQDTTPDAFNFTDQTNVQLSTLTTSASITPTGYDGPVSVSVSGQGSPEISINGGAWGSGGSINPGQTLAVRLTSSGSYLTTLTATVTVGGTSDSWSVQTRPDVTVINISANTGNVNLFTLAGSPVAAGSWEFVIASGVYVYSTNTGNAAITTGVFPAGSGVKITNNGYILGMGGGGGYSAAGGEAGGPAISLANNVTIDNSAGLIYGGGDGGSGGWTFDFMSNSYYGGGGGGGQSYHTSLGGGSPQGGAGNGGNGTFSGPGGGGIGGATGWTAYNNNGASGGSWGNSGKAVAVNGKTITWLGGNDSTHVKGAVN